MGTAADPRTVHSRMRRLAERRFGIDARSLAAFRIALGLVLALDLALRARHLRMLYTDRGVFPVAVLHEQYPTLAQFSLHALSGGVWLQALLFAAAFVAALALAVGYRTRLATLVSLFLLVSLHVRNPHVLMGGDALLEHLLFWSLFLPLGARWSVDTRQHDLPRERVFGVASTGLLGQVALVYGVNAVLKLRTPAWLAGDAVAVTLGLDRFATLLGPVLRESAALLWLVNYAWLGLLVASPLLLLLTGWPRVVLVGAFAGMHGGMLLTMHLGVFPLVSIVALLPFLPGAVWNARESPFPRLSEAASTLLDWLEEWLPAWSPRTPRGLDRWLGRARRTAAAIALAAILLVNAVAVGFVPVPPPADGTLDGDRSDTRWAMFTSRISETDRWYVAPAERPSGERVDAFRDSELSWERPADVTDTHASARSRKYMSNLRWDDRLQEPFAAYLCERWHRTRGERLGTLSVYAVEAPGHASGDGTLERTELVRTDCAT